MDSLSVLVPFAALFGLLSAAAWGTGDFCGGLATKRSPGFRVVMATEFVGALLLAALALIIGESLPSPSSALTAAAAGLAGLVGLAALYQGLAAGQMGVIAPLSAVVGGVIPVLVGLVTQGWPSALQLAGFAVALLAVWLLAGTGEFRPGRRSLALATTAGAGFGVYFVLIAYATEGGLFWNLTVARIVAGLVLVAFLLASRQPLLPDRGVWGLTAGAGMADAGGNLFFALAAQLGRLDAAAILASLYPGTTVLLARMVLHERLSRAQIAGIVAALVAVVLIAA